MTEVITNMTAPEKPRELAQSNSFAEVVEAR